VGGIIQESRAPLSRYTRATSSESADESREVTFHFPDEDVTTHLTHFENNTHRVRLLPLRDIKRPAIVIFRRVGDDEYNCSIVSLKNYAKVLASKCTEQVRKGARKWGLE
jgi:hypothetical protein